MDYFEVITNAQTGDVTIRPFAEDEIAERIASSEAAIESLRGAMRLSFAQLLIGLVAEGWITASDGRSWRDRTALPAQVVALIASLPEDHRFAAETRALAPSEVFRLDPLVVALGSAQGKTPEEIDAFFQTYAAV